MWDFCLFVHVHNFGSTEAGQMRGGEHGEGWGGVWLGGKWGIGVVEGGYISFHWLPIHQGSVYCCASRQAAQKRTRHSNRDPLSVAITHLLADSELCMTFFQSLLLSNFHSLAP